MSYNRFGAGILLFAGCFVPIAAVAQLKLPSTGQGVAPGQSDNYYYIISDTTGESNATPTAPIPAVVVSSLPAGWGFNPDTSAQWIAPAADQSNATRPGNKYRGDVHYMVTFNVTGDPSQVVLNLTFLADDYMDIVLNGVLVIQGDLAFGLEMWQTPSPYTIQFPAGAIGGFQTGQNQLEFVVHNAGGGPTGLNVSFQTSSGGGGAGSTLFPATKPKGNNYALAEVDPVDSATGQLFESVADLRLGGPLSLGFTRYYASQLSAAGFTTSLGPNWMSNFDVSAKTSGTNAQVMLAEGKTLTFSTGNGISWKLVSPLDIAYQFAPAGAGYQLMDPVTERIYTFAASGALTGIQNRNGYALTVTQGANGPTLVSDGLGRSLTFTYTGSSLTRVTDQAGRSVSFTYAGSLLASATDVNGNTTAYTYTSAGSLVGLLTKAQLPSGNTPVSQTYDSSGRVVAQSDANSDATTIAYDGNGGTTITDPLGNASHQGSNSGGDLTSSKDPLGGSAAVTFNSSEQRTSVTDKLGNKVTFTYDPTSGQISSATDFLGNTTLFSYAPQTEGPFTFYNLSSIGYPDQTRSSFTWDANGNLVSTVQRDGTTVQRAFDGHGRLVATEDPLNNVTRYTWNSEDLLASRIDALGNTVALLYDPAGRPTSITAPNGGVTSYAWDAAGHLTSLKDAMGGTASWSYNNDGLRSGLTFADGAAFKFSYTANDQIASMNDPAGNQTTYSWDALGRLAKLRDAAGEVFTTAHDAESHVISQSDSAGVRFSYTYDAKGNLASMTDATSRKWQYGHNADGELTTLTTPGSHTYKRSYDVNGRLYATTDPLGGITSVQRDALGRVVRTNVPGSLSTMIVRDANGRKTAITSPNGNTWKFGYDAANELTSVADPLGNSTTFSWKQNRIVSAQLPLGALTLTSDLNGRVTKRQYSDNATVNRAYDAQGLLTSADNVVIQRNNQGLPTSINGIGIALDGMYRPATLTYAPGKAITYVWDGNGRLASISDWVGGKTTLTHDAAGRITAIAFPNGVQSTYAYDADGRLSQLGAGSLGSIQLTRDAAGKITSAIRSVPLATQPQTSSQQFTHDAAGEVASGTYDAMGRVASLNGRTYQWNLASELASFSDASATTSLTYDGLGEIDTVSSAGSARTYVVNYLLPYPALSIVRQNGTDLRYYVYLPNGKLLYSIEAAGNARHYYQFDEMGNTVFLTDDSGAVSDGYAISPFGEIADHSGSTDNPFTWQGEYGVIQEAAGLYYMRSRHYDAATASFLSRDVVFSTNPHSTEPYSYGNGNPLFYVDPYGSDPTEASTPQEYADNVVNMANNAEGCGLAIFAADPVWAAPCIIAAAIYENPGISWDGLEALAGPPPDVPAPPPPNPPQPLAESSVPLATTPALAASATAASSSALAGASGPTVTAVPVVSNDGGSVVSNDGGSVVSNDGGSLLSEHGNGFSGDSLELMNSALADQTSTVVDQINAMNQDQQTQINAMNQDQQNQIFSDQQQAAADSQAAQTASEPVLNAYAGDQ